MKLKIPTTKKNLFRLRLECLRGIPPLKGLKNRELAVLAELQYHYYLNKDLEPSLRDRKVFDYDTFLQIREALNMSEATFNNNKMILRNKGLIEKKRLNPKFIWGADNEKELSLEFNFNIIDG